MDRYAIGKNYTLAEIKKLYPNTWNKDVPGIIDDRVHIDEYLKNKPSPKKKILNLEDFDEETKNIYLQIKQIILDYNKNSTNIKVWATGSRIYGTWRTKEEEDIRSKFLNKKPKYSDYDYCTDANRIPDKKTFMEKIGIIVDFADCGSYKKVLVP
jgi:hypothetical protein